MLQFLYGIGFHHGLRFYKYGQVTILCLHRISEETDYFFEPIRPELFRKLLIYASKHYTVTTFAALDSIKSRKPLLILSFDDGYFDFVENAMPLLQEFRLPANHNLINACLNGQFVIWTQRLNTIFNHLKQSGINQDANILELTGYQLTADNWHRYYLLVFRYLLGCSMEVKLQLINRLEQRYGVQSNYRMINWAEAAELSKNNVEIGCHTYNHDSLQQITDTLVLQQEINASKKELEQRLGLTIDVIALPNGQFSEKVIEHSQSAGFRYILMPELNRPMLQKVQKGFTASLMPCTALHNENLSAMILRIEGIQPIIKRLIGRKMEY